MASIERLTLLEQPELHRSGLLQIKLAFLLLEDGAEIDCRWHRTAIALDGDVREQMDFVNAHLASMQPPMPPVSAADIDFIVSCHALQKGRFLGSLE